MTASEMVDKMMETASEHYPDAGTINYKAEALDKNLETIMDDVLAYYMAPAIDDPDNNLIRVNGLHTDGMWTTLAGSYAAKCLLYVNGSRAGPDFDELLRI